MLDVMLSREEIVATANKNHFFHREERRGSRFPNEFSKS